MESDEELDDQAAPGGLVASRSAIASDTRELVGSDGAGAAVSVEQPTTDPHHDLTPRPGPARISTLTETVNIPAVWLDRLLMLSQDLPYDQGDAAVVRALVAEVQILVPAIHVGVRPPSVDLSQPSERHVLWTEPPKSDEQARSSRLFPNVAYERSVSFPGGPAAGAIHFASSDDIFHDESSPHVQLMERVAVVAAQALARVYAEDRARTLKTDLRTIKSQMVQAEKLASLGQIAAGMVHELNNPLTSIAAYTDYLLRRSVARAATQTPPDGSPPAASLPPSGPSDLDDIERLRRIAESANRMLRFTRDLVSYARPSSEVPIGVQIHAVIDRALAFCEHEVAGAGVVVRRSFSDEVRDLSGLRGLPEQLAQVFVNLVTNACHAMTKSVELAGHDLPAQPERPALLTIATSVVGQPREPKVMVVLEDSGCGIAKPNLALVFTPFFTTKGAGRGTGLGLSIVKNIIETHQGEIRVESDPSYGTRFVILLPVDPG
jgi:two-component system, NtrC family, sensor kinase